MGDTLLPFAINIHETVRAREAAVPEDPLVGTRLFVCAKNWFLWHSRSLNAHEGPWAGWYRSIHPEQGLSVTPAKGSGHTVQTLTQVDASITYGRKATNDLDP